MKAHFEAELNILRTRVGELAASVVDQVRRAVAVLALPDGATARAVALGDERIDREEVYIEEECLKIMALHAPVADELRYLFGLTKLTHELERIGDLAKKIATQALRKDLPTTVATLAELPRLAELAIISSTKAVEAFLAQDAAQARAVWASDAQLDDIQDRLLAILDGRLGSAGADVQALLAVRSVVSALERIGDHATRIAKVVLYMRHGEIVRHRPVTGQRKRILFICVHNSARSQMAEAWLKHLHGDRFEVESAGLEPGTINPLAIEAMREVGIDISANPTQRVFDLVKSGRLYSYAITVCDDAHAERCPIFAGITRREHWNFPDPAAFTGSHEERLAAARRVRDAIRERIEEWVRSLPA